MPGRATFYRIWKLAKKKGIDINESWRTADLVDPVSAELRK